DTGTAIIMGKKGQRVWTGGGDEAALAQGVYNTYTEDNLRYSQNAPLDMYKEVNTGTNLPSVATPNGQAAFLFLLTSALAPLIRLSYGRMVWM
ncbi:fumarate hydratase, partial [Bifidobacterium bifidum]